MTKKLPPFIPPPPIWLLPVLLCAMLVIMAVEHIVMVIK